MRDLACQSVVWRAGRIISQDPPIGLVQEQTTPSKAEAHRASIKPHAPCLVFVLDFRCEITGRAPEQHKCWRSPGKGGLAVILLLQYLSYCRAVQL
jgi:hypothetical protein